MTLSQRQDSAISSHLDALIAKHALLSQKIDLEMKHPASNGIDLRRWKVQRLKLKEEIESIRQAS